MAWAKNGTPDTLGSAGDTLTISDLTAKKFNQFLVHTLNSGDQRPRFIIENNTNTVYARRSSANGGAESTAGSEANFPLGAITTYSDYFVVSYVVSISGEEKLLIVFLIEQGTAGAATAPSRQEFTGKFVPSPDSDITRFDSSNDQSGDYAISSNLSALGTD